MITWKISQLAGSQWINYQLKVPQCGGGDHNGPGVVAVDRTKIKKIKPNEYNE